MKVQNVPIAYGTAIRFLRDESGAVTIDRIALTASMVFPGAAAGFFASAQVPALASRVDTTLENMPVMSD